ncbi:MAG: DUF72 domain-containing protein [Chitinophagaceae bacterium]
MLFGELKPAQLKDLDFKLPLDPAANKEVLITGKSSPVKVHLGCAKWGRTEWLGKIYPKDAKEKDFLKYYAQHYGSIELNATHYKIYGADIFEGWVKKVNNPSFKFCPKAHRGMSYLKDSPTKAGVTKDYINNIRAFGKQLGPIFITHDEKIKWDVESEKQFFKYLESLPNDITFFIEERWPGFYEDKKLKNRYYAKLRELKMGAVITDTAGRPDVLHMQLTIPKAFVRFVGNSLHPSDYPRIDNWATRFKKWIDSGIEEIYFFMHMHDEGKSPELTQYVVEQFNKKCKLDIPEVEFVK